MLEYKGYTAALSFDDRDNILVGRIAGIKDSVTFHATDVEALREAFVEAIDDYLEQCAESGSPPDKPFSGNLAVRAPSQLHRQIAGLAAAQGVSINQWVVNALEKSASDALSYSTPIAPAGHVTPAQAT